MLVGSFELVLRLRERGEELVHVAAEYFDWSMFTSDMASAVAALSARLGRDQRLLRLPLRVLLLLQRVRVRVAPVDRVVVLLRLLDGRAR